MNMKPAITITTAILVSVLAVSLASAQSPSIIQNTRATMNGVSNNATAGSNAALGTAPTAAVAPAKTSTPVAGSSSPSAAKNPGAKKRARTATAKAKVPGTAIVAVPKNNPPAAAAVPVAGSGE